MGVNIFLLKTKKTTMSHTFKVTAMATSVTVNSASLFPCLDYMDNYLPLCRGSLTPTDKCFIKRTKIDQLISLKQGCSQL